MTFPASLQVGILRRGRYVRGKKMGKGPVAEVVSDSLNPVHYIQNIVTILLLFLLLTPSLCCTCFGGTLDLLASHLKSFVVAASGSRSQQMSTDRALSEMASSLLCNVKGSRVKRGQPLAFIEQLGTYVPVEVRYCRLTFSCPIEVDGMRRNLVRA